MGDFSIGEAARQSGVRVGTIRFYEERGLIPSPLRSDGGRRLYDRRAVARLSFIRHARSLGFALEDIGALLVLQDKPGADCAAADSVARRQLALVTHRITQLTALKHELARMTAGCADGSVAQCRVIESLADHRLCAGDHLVEKGREVPF